MLLETNPCPFEAATATYVDFQNAHTTLDPMLLILSMLGCGAIILLFHFGGPGAYTAPRNCCGNSGGPRSRHAGQQLLDLADFPSVASSFLFRTSCHGVWFTAILE